MEKRNERIFNVYDSNGFLGTVTGDTPKLAATRAYSSLVDKKNKNKIELVLKEIIDTGMYQNTNVNVSN